MHDELIQAFKEAIDPKRVLTGADLKDRIFHIWQMDEPLEAKAVLLPESTEEVSALMRICYENHQPVVVHGGLTNLVGSTETHPDEVVISMERMNKIEEVDEKSRSMTVQAGVILEHIHQAASEKGMLFPLNYGAKGSAQIGGALSTNAGGLRVFRFGMARNLVLGLEVVLADGTIISSLKKIIKDNSAYDLKQLFIGSEGTLGIITRAVLKLEEAPQSRVTALVALASYEKVVEFLKYMDRGMAGTLSGFEILWKPFYQTMTTPPSMVSPPLPHDFDYYVLMEGLGSDQEADQAWLIELLETALENNLILEAAPAQSGSEVDAFWRIREDVSVLTPRTPNAQYFDISLPIPLIGEKVEKMVEELHRLPEVISVFYFGHVADGNIHLVVGKSNQEESLKNKINDIVYGPLKAIGGSVSAEHGIGYHKKAYLPLSRSQTEIMLMEKIKATLDPRKILNRGKVID